MEINPLVQNDLISIPPILPPGWDSAMPSIQFYTSSGFCYPIKVSVDNKIVGTGTAIMHRDVAWLAHIIVHPDHRNQGIGKLITESLIDIAHAKNCATLYLLATELGEPVYRKLGFEAEAEYLFYKGEKLNESAFQDEYILPYSGEYITQISTLDRHVSGEDRMFHLSQYLSSGFVYVVDNSVEGYYLPAMGDGVIIATSSGAGQALMKLRLATKDYAVFPANNTHASAFIRQYPFTQVRIQKRMRLGEKKNWEPANIYNRIGGNLG
jgi:GNAT superfamily N-acetyltransferase